MFKLLIDGVLVQIFMKSSKNMFLFVFEYLYFKQKSNKQSLDIRVLFVHSVIQDIRYSF